MSDMIEAVARAICASHWEDQYGQTVDADTVDNEWFDWKPEAQAAITAHTAALIAGAGDLAAELLRFSDCRTGGDECRASWPTLVEAAALISAFTIVHDTEQTTIAALQARAEAAEARLREWQECALYDATMEGPVFKGWDRSALERCRKQTLGGEHGK